MDEFETMQQKGKNGTSNEEESHVVALGRDRGRG
jgi:hypothetical protein